MVTWRLILVIIMLIPGCVANPVAESVQTASQTASSRSTEQLMELFKQAHEKRDIEVIRQLVYWDGVDAKTRETVEKSISADFGLSVKRIFIEQLPKDEKLEYTQGGVTYRPNLVPIGSMRVEFAAPPEGQEGAQTTGSGYLVGVKDKKHFIVTAVPAVQ